MRQPFIAGNWKMYKTAGEAIAAGHAPWRGALSQEKDRKIMIAPPFTALHAVRDVARRDRGSSWARRTPAAELEGAHTGEISLRMLATPGSPSSSSGHSERRHVYGETDALVNRKVKLALAEGFEVILCVGETLDERQKGVTEKVVETQTPRGLAGVAEKDLAPRHHRLRAGLGHRDGQERHAAGRGRRAQVHPRRDRRPLRRKAAARQ